MKHIEINIGKACNNKCRFCMSAGVGYDHKQLTSFEIVKEEIEKYYNKGYRSIGFLGGDISIHPSIFKIIFFSKSIGFKSINIITNGMVFSDYNKALTIIESGVTRVNISVHSHIGNIEDYITQITGGLKKKYLAIDNFQNLYFSGILKSPISINMVLNKLNYNTIFKSLIFFYKIKKIKDIRINFLWNRYFFSDKDKNEMELSYTELLPYLNKIVIFSLKTDLRLTFEGIPYCVFYKIGINNIDKYVSRFVYEDRDHIEEVSNLNMDLSFNRKDEKKSKFKTKFNSCIICKFNNKCNGVWNEYVDSFGNEEFIYIFNPILDYNNFLYNSTFPLEKLETPISIKHYYFYLDYILSKNNNIKLLEVGSYLGYFLDILINLGINAYGVEKYYNENALCKDNTFFQDIIHFDVECRYDIIIAVNFFNNTNLSHIDKYIFLDNCITKVLSLLKDGGEFIFNFDNNIDGFKNFNIIKNKYPEVEIISNNICLIKNNNV